MPSINNIKLYLGCVGWEESLCGWACAELEVSRIWKVTELVWASVPAADLLQPIGPRSAIAQCANK